MKISKPFAKRFNTLLNGEVVSYSPSACKVAIGKDAVKVTKEAMDEILNSSNAYGDRFTAVISAFNQANYC